MSRRTVLELAGPVGLVVLVGLVGSSLSASSQIDVIGALIQIAIVVSIYVFVGNSGVVSFGHVAFVAVGAFTAGVLTVPAGIKPTLLPNLFGVLSSAEVSSPVSLAAAAAAGGVLALVAGLPLMRLSGLAAGIATLALLEIVHNVLRYWERIGPGAKTLSLVPETTTVWQATLGAASICVVAYGFQRSRSGRLLRATREDGAAAQAVGIGIDRQRLGAFVLSGVLAGLAGGLLVHSLGSITTEQVYLQLAFITLAMLVVGGVGSLWGAVLGALLVSVLQIYLTRAEDGTSIGPLAVDLPDGLSVVILGLLMLIVLVTRPRGLTRGREFGTFPGRRRRGSAVEPSATAGPSGSLT